MRFEKQNLLHPTLPKVAFIPQMNGVHEKLVAAEVAGEGGKRVGCFIWQTPFGAAGRGTTDIPQNPQLVDLSPFRRKPSIDVGIKAKDEGSKGK